MRRSPEDRRNHLDEDSTTTETKLQSTEHHEEPPELRPAELHPPSSFLTLNTLRVTLTTL